MTGPLEAWDAVLSSVYAAATLAAVTAVVFNLQAAVYMAKNARYLALVFLALGGAAAAARARLHLDRVGALRERLREGVLSYKKCDVSPGVTANEVRALVSLGWVDYLGSSESVVALFLRVVDGSRSRTLRGDFVFEPGLLYSTTRALRVVAVDSRPVLFGGLRIASPTNQNHVRIGVVQ